MGRVTAVVVLAAGALAGCEGREQVVAVHDLTTRSAAPTAAAPTAAPVETQSDKIKNAPTLEAALVIAKPAMGDTFNKMSDGAVQLSIWAMPSMRWSDVAVTKDETTIALTMKDPDEARGKRMCIGGSIIQIEVVKTDHGKGFDGLMRTGAANLISFFAVGSSGDLVKRSPARICGVVTGKYDYSNSGGGTGHAVQMVGMFDLPENRGAK